MEGLLLHQYACIDGDDVVLVGQQGIDVHFLDFGGEAQEGGEAHDDFSIAALVDAALSACALQYLVGTQGVNHGVGLFVAQRGEAGGYVAQHLDEDAAQTGRARCP